MTNTKINREIIESMKENKGKINILIYFFNLVRNKIQNQEDDSNMFERAKDDYQQFGKVDRDGDGNTTSGRGRGRGKGKNRNRNKKKKRGSKGVKIGN